LYQTAAHIIFSFIFFWLKEALAITTPKQDGWLSELFFFIQYHKLGNIHTDFRLR